MAITLSFFLLLLGGLFLLVLFEGLRADALLVCTLLSNLVQHLVLLLSVLCLCTNDVLLSPNIRLEGCMDEHSEAFGQAHRVQLILDLALLPVQWRIMPDLVLQTDHALHEDDFLHETFELGQQESSHGHTLHEV